MSALSDLETTTTAANTWAAQLKAGTPYAWAEAATLIGLTNLAKDLAPPVVVTPTPPTPPVTTATILGVYTGPNSTSSAESLASQLGVTLTGYSTYNTGSSWASMGQYTPPKLPAGVEWLLLAPDLTADGTGLSAVAANLASFKQLAKNLIGTPTICRLGCEFDGSWKPWGTGANGNKATDFNPAVSLVIPAMKAVNPALKFDFCCNSGTSTLAQLEVYYGANGDSLWDFIGGDHYDNKGGGGNTSQLTAALQLAQARKKPFSIGEWGLNGADNPAFITAMAAFIKNPANIVGYHSYFSDDLDINSDITQFPKSIAAFKAALA